jgi:hypothetical protein
MENTLIILKTIIYLYLISWYITTNEAVQNLSGNLEERFLIYKIFFSKFISCPYCCAFWTVWIGLFLKIKVNDILLYALAVSFFVKLIKQMYDHAQRVDSQRD